MKPYLTIAMPAHNEEGSILSVIKEAQDTIGKTQKTGEILIIDDGSTDRTSELVKSAMQNDNQIRLIQHVTNEGIGSFNRKMVAEARGQWVLCISSDGEADPSQAIEMLRIAESQNLDGVLTYRVEKKYTLYRNVISYSFNGLIALFFGHYFRDVGSMRLLKTELFGPLKLYSTSAFINAERLLVGVRKGARYTYVPTSHRNRRSGKGRGARFSWVMASTKDLIKTRLRWFCFKSFYQ